MRKWLSENQQALFSENASVLLGIATGVSGGKRQVSLRRPDQKDGPKNL